MWEHFDINFPSLCLKWFPIRPYHCMNIHTTVQSQPAQVEGSNEKTRMKGSEQKRKGGAEVNQESTDQVSRSQSLWIMEFHNSKELMEEEIKPWSDYNSNTLLTSGAFQIQPELKASNRIMDWQIEICTSNMIIGRWEVGSPNFIKSLKNSLLWAVN